MFDPQTFVIPDNTKMEEHTIVVDGAVIIGSGSTIEYGIIADEITTGERMKIYGGISCTSDVYIDRRSEIGGAVRTNGDAYLGEFSKVNGKLTVAGDLNIGDHVSIKDGFEAKGWITIRNPIPVIIFLYFYLIELISHGRDEEVEKALEDLFSDESDDTDGRTMIIPSKSMITMSTIESSLPLHIGDNCRMQGNIRAESLVMGSNTTLFGSIRAKDVTIGRNSVVHGNVDASGDVRINSGSHVLGDLRARVINIHRSATVDGMMDAPRGIVVDDGGGDAGDLVTQAIKTPSLASTPEALGEVGTRLGEVDEAGGAAGAEVVERVVKRERSKRERKNERVRPSRMRERENIARPRSRYRPGRTHERRYYVRRRGTERR